MKNLKNAEAVLVSFGNYLLSEQREQTIEQKENACMVHDCDLANWRDTCGVPENGIYIPDENRCLHPLDEWMKREDPTTAQTVVLVTDSGMLEIAKENLPGEFEFKDAQKAAAEYREGFRCATRHETIEMYDARFRGLDEAFEKIGGKPATNIYWTSEADPDPEYNSNYAFFYGGSTGGMGNYGKYNASAVRPVSAFKK